MSLGCRDGRVNGYPVRQQTPASTRWSVAGAGKTRRGGDRVVSNRRCSDREVWSPPGIFVRRKPPVGLTTSRGKSKFLRLPQEEREPRDRHRVCRDAKP